MAARAITVAMGRGKPDVTVYLRPAKRDTERWLTNRDRHGKILPMYAVCDGTGEDARLLGRVYQIERASHRMSGRIITRTSYPKQWNWDTEPVDSPTDHHATWATREMAVQDMVRTLAPETAG